MRTGFFNCRGRSWSSVTSQGWPCRSLLSKAVVGLNVGELSGTRDSEFPIKALLVFSSDKLASLAGMQVNLERVLFATCIAWLSSYKMSDKRGPQPPPVVLPLAALTATSSSPPVVLSLGAVSICETCGSNFTYAKDLNEHRTSDCPGQEQAVDALESE